MLSLEMTYFVARNELADRLPLGLAIGDTPIGLLAKPAATELLEKRIAEFSTHPLRFKFENQTFEIAPTRIDLRFELAGKIDLLASELVNFGSENLPVELNEKRLRGILLAEFPTLEFGATDAKVFLGENGELKILSEKRGHKTDFAEIAAAVRKNAGKFADAEIAITSESIEPQIFAAELEPFRDELAGIVAEKLVLKKTNYERFEIELTDRIAWFGFDGERIFLKKDAVVRFIEKELNPLLAELPRDISISKNAAGGIEFDGIAANGRATDAKKLFAAMSTAFENNWREVEIPFRELSAPVRASSELAALGIVELVGEAVTNYDGSPGNRQHNIRVAATELDGKIIPAGAEFSFIENLGAVTLANGYRQELVIKEGAIIPEVGGGVCQVSTTFFRTALNAGVPITAQKPHSMKVSYYDPPGLDATVYPGSADLKFLNDTGAPILIQTAIEGTSLRVNFFGRKDDREVKLAGPFYPNGDPVTNLRFAGMRMFWTREVAQSGETTISEKYSASYKFMPKH